MNHLMRTFSIIVATTGIILCACEEDKQIGHPPEASLHNDLLAVIQLALVISEANAEDLPQGMSSGVLIAWLKEKDQASTAMIFESRRGIKLDEDVLRDVWGSEIIYRRPSDIPGYLCRFYSIGLNRRDDGGKDDDVDLSPRMDEVRK